MDDYFGRLGEKDVGKEGGKRRGQLVNYGTDAMKTNCVFREFTQRR